METNSFPPWRIKMNPLQEALDLIEDGDVSAHDMLMACLKSMTPSAIHVMLEYNKFQYPDLGDMENDGSEDYEGGWHKEYDDGEL